MDHSDVLLKAASIVEERWGQGAMWTLEGRSIAPSSAAQKLIDQGQPVKACAIGAIYLAGHQLGALTHVQGAAIVAADNLAQRECGTTISRWNDQSARTKFEVAELLRKAAE